MTVAPSEAAGERARVVPAAHSTRSAHPKHRRSRTKIPPPVAAPQCAVDTRFVETSRHRDSVPTINLDDVKLYRIEEQELGLIDAVGAVEITHQGEISILPLGRKIRPGDSVRTSIGGRALLSGLGGERIALGPSTAGMIEELSASNSDRRVVVRIDRGSMHFSAPQTPFMARYLFETPSGSVSARFGDFWVHVAPPDLTALSVLAGTVLATVPRGNVEISAGYGATMRTTEMPPPAVPLPSVPGLSVETTGSLAIVAAATRPGHTIWLSIFEDPDAGKLFAQRILQPDNVGVALTRVELPRSTSDGLVRKYWIVCRAVDAHGLTSAPAMSDAFTIQGN